MDKGNCGAHVDWTTIIANTLITILLGSFGWALYKINDIDQQQKESLIKIKDFDDVKIQIQNLSTSTTEILTTVRTIQAVCLPKPEPSPPVPKPTFREQSVLPSTPGKPERYDPAKLADFSVRHKIPQSQYNFILKSLNTLPKETAKTQIEGIITDTGEAKRLFDEIY